MTEASLKSVYIPLCVCVSIAMQSSLAVLKQSCANGSSEQSPPVPQQPERPAKRSRDEAENEWSPERQRAKRERGQASTQQAAKRKRTEVVGDAEEPTRRRHNGAEQPASPQESHGLSVAFITTGRVPDKFETNADWRRLLGAVQNTLDAGASVVNIAYSTSLTNQEIKAALLELDKAFTGAWGDGGAQPAYQVRHQRSVMTFFKHSCKLVTEQEIMLGSFFPAFLFVLATPQGRLCVVNTSVPHDTLARTTRKRILHEVTEAAQAVRPNNILIGGSWTEVFLFMENEVAQLPILFRSFSNKNLELLAHSQSFNDFVCIPVDSDGPHWLACVRA